MKFWKYLRWAGAALFICMFLLAWLGHDPDSSAGGGVAEPPPAPRIP
jgi:hypothetical protein